MIWELVGGSKDSLVPSLGMIFFLRSIHLAFNFTMSLFLTSEEYFTEQMYHIFFTHSSVKELLGCFQFQAIMNKADMDIVEHMTLWEDGPFLGYIPRSAIVESRGSSVFSIFWESIILVSKVAVQVRTRTSSGGMFPLLHILDSTYMLDLSHSDRYKTES